ncbi:MAG: Holliday junction resolvase RuvX [Patescibacteria group bacterium]|nr:Holliday junction resolvase RuvX [Patescibacteria group bacterium]
MSILGVDFGKKRIGLAISEGLLARPLATVSYKMEKEALERIIRITQEQEIGQIIFGVPEPDTIGAKDFGEKLSKLSGIPVVFVNETLTSEVAKEKLLKSGTSKKKRKIMIDEIAAATILQSYLDTHEEKENF